MIYNIHYIHTVYCTFPHLPAKFGPHVHPGNPFGPVFPARGISAHRNESSPPLTSTRTEEHSGETRVSQEGSLISKERLDKNKTVKFAVSTGHGCKAQQRQSVPCLWGDKRHLFGGLPKETLFLGNCLRMKCLGTSHFQRKPNIIPWPYRMLTSLQDPLFPGVSKGLPFHLNHKLGSVRIASQTAKVTCSSSLLYDVLHYFPSLLQYSSWEVAPAPFFNIGFNYLEEGL